MPFKINPFTGKFDYFMEAIADQKIWLDRTTDSYLIYNSTTGRVELWRGGVKKQSW